VTAARAEGHSGNIASSPDRYAIRQQEIRERLDAVRDRLDALRSRPDRPSAHEAMIRAADESKAAG
jgi:hypothetical protein